MKGNKYVVVLEGKFESYSAFVATFLQLHFFVIKIRTSTYDRHVLQRLLRKANMAVLKSEFLLYHEQFYKKITGLDLVLIF